MNGLPEEKGIVVRFAKEFSVNERTAQKWRK